MNSESREATIRPCISAFPLLLAAAACAGLSNEDAAQLVREATAPGTAVEYVRYLGGYSPGDDALDLERLGLVTLTAGDIRSNRPLRVSLTPEGARLGLALEPRDDGYLLRGALCRIVFADAGPLKEVASDSVRYLAADLEFRHGEFTELLQRLRATRALDPPQCDTAAVLRRQGQFLLEKGTWRLNAPPRIPGNVSTSVSYEYDNFGSRTGAKNELRIPAPIDPDGDSVTVVWFGRVFNGDSLVPMPDLQSSGLTATFRGLSGALVLAIARDRWGASDTAEFCFQSRRFSC